MKKLLFIGLMIGASSVAGANTPLAIQYGNPAASVHDKNR